MYDVSGRMADFLRTWWGKSAVVLGAVALVLAVLEPGVNLWDRFFGEDDDSEEPTASTASTDPPRTQAGAIGSTSVPGAPSPVFEATYSPSQMFWVLPGAESASRPDDHGSVGDNMCDSWQPWLDAAGAMRQAGNPHGIDLLVAARLEVPATILAIEPVVVEAVADEEAALISCVVGGGSNAAFESELGLAEPGGGLSITQFDSTEPPVLVPPGSFEIGAGLVESLRLYPTGTPGTMYRFRLKITHMVDGNRRDEVVDDHGKPFAFGIPSSSTPAFAPGDP